MSSLDNFQELTDFHDDFNKNIRKEIEEVYEVPLFAKFASMSDENLKVNKTAFALPNQSKFAMDSEADIWWSKRYLEKNKAASLIDPYSYDIVNDNLNAMAKFYNNPDLIEEPVKKVAHIEDELIIPAESFGVCLNFNSLSPGMKSKYASYEYNGNLALYPLDTPEQIASSNESFPNALDDELEMFRAPVARKLASLVEEDELSPEVQAYLPQGFSVFKKDIEARKERFQKFASDFEKAENEFKSGNLIKTASMLNALDLKTGAHILYDKGILNPLDYMKGSYDDTDYSYEKVKVANMEYDYNAFENNSDALKKVIPEIPTENYNKLVDYMDTSDDFTKKAVNAVFKSIGVF